MTTFATTPVKNWRILLRLSFLLLCPCRWQLVQCFYSALKVIFCSIQIHRQRLKSDSHRGSTDWIRRGIPPMLCPTGQRCTEVKCDVYNCHALFRLGCILHRGFFLALCRVLKVKVNGPYTTREHRRGAHLPV